MDVTPISGTPFTLRHGDDVVEIASVGASLRRYRHAGRDLVVPFNAEELRPAFRGATVAPWPNRVTDGRYVFEDVSHQLALTEPARGHALHGLTPWADFAPLDEEENSVTLATIIEPQAGYPWRIFLETTYTLDDDGLTQMVIATNHSGTPAPYGVCPHPYLRAGDAPLEEWTLELPANEVLLVDDRLTPTGLSDVGTDPARFDFRAPRAIGTAEIDHAFTSFNRDENGECRVRLTAPDGRGVAMSWSDDCSWLQVHTADLDPADPDHRAGLAVEPMTCAPDAFNSGTGLIVLEPGHTHNAAWRITPID